MLQDAKKAAEADMLEYGIHMSPVDAAEMAMIKHICGE
jgi:hypothetical protein